MRRLGEVNSLSQREDLNFDGLKSIWKLFSGFVPSLGLDLRRVEKGVLNDENFRKERCYYQKIAWRVESKGHKNSDLLKKNVIFPEI